MDITLPRHSVTFFEDDGLEVELPLQGAPVVRRVVYNADSLKVWGKNLAFLADEKFKRAYARGMDSGHQIMRPPGSKEDLHVEFRVHVLLWAASIAARLSGDFVECGVNTGIYSLAVCDYLDFARLDRRFYLFDTFRGVPDEQVRPEEVLRTEEHKPYYVDCLETARRNFAPFPNAVLVPGIIPGTLSSVGIERVAYLSIDLNIAAPERAAIEFFWDKLSPGAPVILDDYAWFGYETQKAAMDEFAAGRDTAILTLPTGQGLLIKS